MKAMIALCCAAVASSAAVAQPITYSFTGTGSGAVGLTDFESFNFEITLSGDFSSVFSTGPGLLRFETTSATISIDGLLSDAVFNPTISLVANNNSDILVFGNASTNQALIVMDNPEFVDYDLSAPFGPVTDTTPGATFQFVALSTTGGFVTLDEISTVTYNAVPTPAAAGLLAVGGLVAARRRRSS